ncbi:MAG: hypothetical protein MUF87_08645 [Anaerolineae bacterium]|jgi:hypothetical protein|nr:hypothetical protein [Anaerolineae bacterium]
MSEPTLPRKWAVKFGDHRIILTKGPNESARHVIMKALLWALYLPLYPTLTVEIRIGDKYKPDLVAFDPLPSIYQRDQPLFWGESGVVGADKVASIVRRYPETHFAIAKWETTLKPHTRIILEALDGVNRSAPFDLIAFPGDSFDRFIGSDGVIKVRFEDLQWMRWE